MEVESQVTELPDWLGDPRLVVFIGDGGVGKTTCSAAAAVAAARAGKRVCVLTIDPSARLAQALGLHALVDTPTRIDPGTIGINGNGSLDALRLDTEATFHRLVRSLAPDEERAEIVLASPIYRAIAGKLGGSDAYMAFQRVYELNGEDLYDLVIIDTPPAAHADELLSAPTRLASLLDTGATRILADPAVAALRAGSKLAAIAIRAAIGAVSRIAGTELTTRISAFADAFEDILISLSARADQVGELLRSDACRFVHVATADRSRIGEARDVEQSLRAHGIEVSMRIVNRVLPREQTPPMLPFEAPGGTAAASAEIGKRMDQLRQRQNAAIAELASPVLPLVVLHEDSALRGRVEAPSGAGALIDLAEALLEACKR
jgi:anion-transporting  ArsA/GET3 family ATPase